MRVATLLLGLVLAAGPAAAGDLWWVFFTKGPNRPEVDAAVLQEQQKAHLGNLERMWNEGVAHLAGPLGDDGFLRGIVVMTAPSREELIRQFAGDPFVGNGRLAVEAMRWDGSVARLGKPREPMALEQATLVIVRRGPAFADGARLSADLVRRLEEEGGLVLAGAVHEAGDKEAILLFRGTDSAAIEASLAADPAVAGGQLALESHPQYLGAGMLDAPAPAAAAEP